MSKCTENRFLYAEVAMLQEILAVVHSSDRNALALKKNTRKSSVSGLQKLGIRVLWTFLLKKFSLEFEFTQNLQLRVPEIEQIIDKFWQSVIPFLTKISPYLSENLI